MKKIFMSAAVMALFTCSCTENEMIENVSDGQAFTLEVNQGVGSRTALDGNQTVWSQGDEIYVTSANGRVTGVLTLKQGVGSANGTFEGFIFGGEPSELEHIVFPVPVDGKIPMGKTSSEDKLDIPMTGSIESGQLSNVGGLIKLPITAGANVDLNVKNGETEVLCGHYEFESSTGELTFVPDPNGSVKITVPAEGFVLLPVATDNVQGVEESELEDEVAIEVNNEVAVVAPVEEGKVSENTVPEVEVGEEGEISTKVDTEARLVSAIAVGGYIKLDGAIELANILEIPAKAEVELDLNGFALAGSITNNGVLIIDDSSEVYKRQASSFSVTGGSTFIQGGSFTTDISAKLNGEMYSCVQNGEQWVVLPKASVFDNIEDVITNAKDGAVLYLVAGTYTFVGDQNVFQNKSFTLVGLGETNIEGTNGYTWKLDATEEGHIVNLKNVSLSIAENSSRGKINIVYVKNYLTVNLFNVTCGVSNGEAIVLDSGNQVNGEWVEGVRTVVNAYDVIVQENDVVAFMARPCRTGDYLENKTYTEFNFKNELSGNISICRPQKDAWSTGDNMFVNGVALPAYQAPAEDAE